MVWISQFTVPFSSVPMRIPGTALSARAGIASPDRIAAPPSRVILLVVCIFGLPMRWSVWFLSGRVSENLTCKGGMSNTSEVVAESRHLRHEACAIPARP